MLSTPAVDSVVIFDDSTVCDANDIFCTFLFSTISLLVANALKKERVCSVVRLLV